MKVKAQDLKNMSKEELREANLEWPETKEELLEIIEVLESRDHDYGTCIYAMSLAMVSAKRYISHKLGVTGFQAGCADLDVLARERNLKWGKLVDFEDLLYPHGWSEEKFPTPEKIWRKNKDKFAEKAQEKIKETSKDRVHPKVWRYWQNLANKRHPVPD